MGFFKYVHWQPWLQNIRARAQMSAWRVWRESKWTTFQKERFSKNATERRLYL